MLLAIGLLITVSSYGKIADDNYEKQLLNRLSDKLVKAITHNNEAKQPGKNKHYLVVDDGKNNFYPWFTSENAGKMWFDSYTPYANGYNDVILRDINQQIVDLKENYLDDTKYKDYDIYFVISGIYYAKNVDNKDREQDLDWKNIKSRSFDNDARYESVNSAGTAQADMEKYVSGLTNKLLQKVHDGVSKDMINYSEFEYNKGGKTLIIFKWVMFDITTKTNSDFVFMPSLVPAATNTIETNLTKFLNSYQESSMYVVDGIRYYVKYQDDIKGLLNFLNRDSKGDIADYDGLTTRNNKLLKDITNTFLFFNQQDKGALLKDFCKATATGKADMLEKIAQTYAIPSEGRAMRNPAAFTGLSFEDRQCLLEYLMNKKLCTDIKAWASTANGCENVLLDVIEGTPLEQKQQMLDFFNLPANYSKLLNSVDDAGGEDNYTAAVFILSNMAETLHYGTIANQEVDGKVFKWFEKEIGSYRAKIISKVSVTVDDKQGLQFSTTEGIKVRFKNLEPVKFPYCMPFTPVRLLVTKKIAYITRPDGSPVEEGETITVPAVFLEWVIQNEFKTELAEQARNMVLTVAIFTGTGELVMATSTAARVWAAADLFFTTASVVTQNEDVRAYVKGKWGDDGLETLNTIDDIGTFVGCVYLTRGIMKSIDEAVEKAATRRIIREMAEDARMRGYAKELADIEKLLQKILLENDLLQQIKKSLLERIAKESTEFTMRFGDDELRAVIKKGLDLDLPDREIEDIIFNGCRNAKDFKVDDLLSQCSFWKIVKERGYPNLFNTLDEYEKFSTVLKDMAKAWDLPEGSIFVQGSSLKVADAAKIGDIDVAIKVDAATFDKLVERFKSATTVNGKIKVIEEQAAKGKIASGLMYLGKDAKGSFKGKFWEALETNVDTKGFAARMKNTNLDFQISVIKISDKLDVSPYLKLK